MIAQGVEKHFIAHPAAAVYNKPISLHIGG